MSIYNYAAREYTSVENVEAAVTAMKTRLDNNPTDWCVVKPMINPRTIAIYSGDVIGYDSGEPLTDAQINALSNSDTVYNIYSVRDGYNYTTLSEADTIKKVSEMRKSWAIWNRVDVYVEITAENNIIEHDVTNEDMSGYV
jgi:hypothetical protein|tara:strand:- start:39 stop:461 length:423 start_codon:yes stop_codon:yes gene_type:complete